MSNMLDHAKEHAKHVNKHVKHAKEHVIHVKEHNQHVKHVEHVNVLGHVGHGIYIKHACTCTCFFI